jgi:predicted Zn-dependent protease
LQRALPAALCAGMIQFILNFAGFPGEEGRLPVAETLHERVRDLLDLCDWLTTRDPASVLAYAQDYEDHQQYRRAEQLLTDHTLRHPQDADVVARLAAVQWKRKNLEEAAQTYRSAVELAPRAAARRKTWRACRQ